MVTPLWLKVGVLRCSLVGTLESKSQKGREKERDKEREIEWGTQQKERKSKVGREKKSNNIEKKGQEKRVRYEMQEKKEKELKKQNTNHAWKAS